MKTSRKPQITDDATTETLRLQIEDTLYQTVLQDYSVQQIRYETKQMRPGLYLSFYIPGQFVQRAYYLGDTVKTINTRFSAFSKLWMV